LEFDFEFHYSPGAIHHGANTLSRLRSTDPDIAAPDTAVDTDIPCFATFLDAPPRDPSLVARDDLRVAQQADPTCRDLLTHLGANPQIEFDEFGILGWMLPSGEFQVTMPSLGDLPLPISIVCDAQLPEENSNVIDDEDAPILRRGR
jgi:hypothetical protein